MKNEKYLSLMSEIWRALKQMFMKLPGVSMIYVNSIKTFKSENTE